jgi:hypothetical protein
MMRHARMCPANRAMRACAVERTDIMREVRFSWVKRFRSGYFNPHHNIALTVDKRTVELESNAGSRDDVHVYRDKEHVYVLVAQPRMSYYGLTVYNLKDDATSKDCVGEPPYVSIDERPGNVFLQQDTDIIETLGKRHDTMAPRTMLNRLLPYLGDG